MAHVTFKNITLKNIAGYKISSCFEIQNGINDNFFIYIHEYKSEQNDLIAFDLSKPAPANGRIRSTLQIFDDSNYRDYSFEEIDLVGAHTYITHKGKNRILIFQYDALITNAGNFCTMSNKQAPDTSSNYPTRTAAEYFYKINQPEEPMLSFSSSFNRTGKQILQIASKRSSDNSFLELILKLDKERRNNGIQAQKIRYKDLETELNANTLFAIYVDESYGSMLFERLPSLEEIALTQDLSRLVKLNYKPFIPLDYLNHAYGNFTNPRQDYPYSVETTAIMLNAGCELDKSSAII
jgi:hypothetical protein